MASNTTLEFSVREAKTQGLARRIPDNKESNIKNFLTRK